MKMSLICAEIAVVLVIFTVWMPITANNITTDTKRENQSAIQVNGSTATSHYHKLIKRCWNKVIPGRPTLARVVVAGTFFILAAVIAGLCLFFYIYFRHKDEYADFEEGLLSRRRCFKPHLEDVEAGLSRYMTTLVPFMRRVQPRIFWRTKKEDEDGDDREDDDGYTQSEKSFQSLSNMLGRKMKSKMRDDDENDRQVGDRDLRKPGKDQNMKKVKEKPKTTEQERSSDMSVPLKKKDKGDLKKKDGKTLKKDNKSAQKTEKLQKTTEGTSKREDKNVKKSKAYTQAKPAQKERKKKILKEVKTVKSSKLKKEKITKPKKTKTPTVRKKKR
ncbi:uncharacterized protein LOC143805280 isoform X2 [Ranitomeya variabilis]|uniref:uncharacterized protein LOC143805280 isoform X2 n=1 Tax=Ranitomeya variabilis TaxID=490064 RepID=UPI0040564749